MTNLRAGVLALVVALAGCANAPATQTGEAPTASALVEETPPPCPTPEEAEKVYRAAELGLEGRAFNMRLEGIQHGESASTLVSIDPYHDRARLYDAGNGVDVRVEGAEYSVRIDESDELFYGRDHRPGATFARVHELFLEAMTVDEQMGFADDFGFEDFEASCSELDGVAVLRYAASRESVEVVMFIEKEGRHRLLSGSVVDPTIEDRYRVSMSYEVPPVDVDTTLPRRSATLSFEVLEGGTNERGGLRMVGEFTASSHVVPLVAMTFRLVDAQNGTVFIEGPLEEGGFDLADGDLFEFEDVDDDGMLGEGDLFYMDLGPGLDIAFYDAWAGAPVSYDMPPGGSGRAQGSALDGPEVRAV